MARSSARPGSADPGRSFRAVTAVGRSCAIVHSCSSATAKARRIFFQPPRRHRRELAPPVLERRQNRHMRHEGTCGSREAQVRALQIVCAFIRASAHRLRVRPRSSTPPARSSALQHTACAFIRAPAHSSTPPSRQGLFDLPRHLRRELGPSVLAWRRITRVSGAKVFVASRQGWTPAQPRPVERSPSTRRALSASPEATSTATAWRLRSPLHPRACSNGANG